jgi:hypothetical protein
MVYTPIIFKKNKHEEFGTPKLRFTKATNVFTKYSILVPSR